MKEPDLPPLTNCPHAVNTEGCDCGCRWCTTLNDTCVTREVFLTELPQHRRALIDGFVTEAVQRSDRYGHYGLLHIQIEDGNLEFDFIPQQTWHPQPYAPADMVFGTLWNALTPLERILAYEFFSTHDWGFTTGGRPSEDLL